MDDAKARRLAVLRQRIERTARRLVELRRVESRFPWLRLAALLAGLLIVLVIFQLVSSPLEWLAALAALAGFVLLALRHRAVVERIDRLAVFERLLQAHAARMAIDWAGIPAPSPLEPGAQHPFAADLNVTGERSLHQLLDTTTSLGGSQRLADWLLEPAPDPARIARRQSLVRELLARPGLRQSLELDGTLANPHAPARWDSSNLLRWLESHTTAGSLRPFLIALAGLALANWVLFALHAQGLLPPLWIGSLILYLGLQSFRFRETSEAFDESYSLARQLGQLRQVLLGLEEYPFQPGSQLAGLCGPICAAAQRPSQALRKISSIATAASLRNNPFLSLTLNLLLPWDVYFAYQLERYKLALRGSLPAWLEAWYEIEALSALATFAAHNPASTFPEILPPGGQPAFEALDLGHPLIPDPARIDNDFRITALGEVVIITGSNMSGKSTFLRTVGANLVLAYAGCTVTARALRCLPFRLFTSMNLSDSLSDGISFFYAEVRRLKALLDQLDSLQAQPLFFLIDEIFRGTNNRERQLGSRAYTEALAGKNGAGLISTHDLELAHLAENFAQVRNSHFREDVDGDMMIFDYKIHPGPSPTTNALRIMALAGLPVPPSQSG